MEMISYRTSYWPPILLCVLSLLLTAAAADNTRIPVSARSAATGESILATVDDATAVYWNPAGLSAVGKNEISSMWSNLHGLEGLDNAYLAYAKPVSSKLGIGIDWMHMGFSDPDFFYHQNRYAVALGYRLHSRLALGATAKMLSLDAGLQDIANPQDFSSSGSALGYDFGVVISPSNGLKLGIVAQDIGGTDLEYGNGIKRPFFRSDLRFGVAWTAMPQLSLTCGLDQSARFGAEYQIHPVLTLRAGAHRNRDSNANDGLGYAFGTGLHLQQFDLDYAYSSLPDLGVTHRFSLNFSFHLTRSAVRIEHFEVDDLLPAFSHRYRSESIGTISLANADDEPVEATLRLAIPEIMDQPLETTHALQPGAKRKVELPGNFSTRLAYMDKQRSLKARIEVTYTRSGRKFSTAETAEVLVHPNRSLRWHEPGVAAAFIDPTNATIVELVEGATDLGLKAPSIQDAERLFTVLEQREIRYRPDPGLPYSNAARSSETVDSIKRPEEIVAEGYGDSDELTILYASMLERTGIATALIAAPGHMLPALATDLTMENIPDAQRNEYISYQDQLWLPIEVRLLGSGFSEARNAAAAELLHLKNRADFKIVTTADAWTTYPPNPQTEK